MLSSSVQGVKVQQKAPLHRRSHGEGPRHCQPRQLSDRTGHGCTWWKRHTAKRPRDGKDRRHRVMLQPLHVGDVASWHRVPRHPRTVGRHLVSPAVLLGRIVGDDLNPLGDFCIYQPFHQILQCETESHRGNSIIMLVKRNFAQVLEKFQRLEQLEMSGFCCTLAIFAYSIRYKQLNATACHANQLIWHKAFSRN